MPPPAAGLNPGTVRIEIGFQAAGLGRAHPEYSFESK
jgi:hypothetical protein